MVPALGAGVPSIHPEVWEVLLKEVGCGLQGEGPPSSSSSLGGCHALLPGTLQPHASHPRLDLGSPGEALKQDLSRAPPSAVLSHWSWGGTCLVVLKALR